MSDKILKKFRDCTPVFQAMLDPYRQDILLMLCEEGPLTVKQITERSSLSRSAISHHLKVLKLVGLARSNKRGTEQFYVAYLEDSVILLKNLVQELEAKTPKNEL